MSCTRYYRHDTYAYFYQKKTNKKNKKRPRDRTKRNNELTSAHITTSTAVTCTDTRKNSNPVYANINITTIATYCSCCTDWFIIVQLRVCAHDTRPSLWLGARRTGRREAGVVVCVRWGVRRRRDHQIIDKRHHNTCIPFYRGIVPVCDTIRAVSQLGEPPLKSLRHKWCYSYYSMNSIDVVLLLPMYSVDTYALYDKRDILASY